jgi:hypothetical protein
LKHIHHGYEREDASAVASAAAEGGEDMTLPPREEMNYTNNPWIFSQKVK